MITALAALSSLAGAAVVYLAHPNQILRVRRLPAIAGWAGGLACLAGLALWMVSHGVIVGLCLATTLWMLVGVGLPYLAAWADARRPRAARVSTARRVERRLQGRRTERATGEVHP